MALILAAVMAVSMVACGGPQPQQGTDDNSQSQEIVSTPDENSEQEEIRRTGNGICMLTKEQAQPYITRVELTMDNWRQYFGNHEVPYHFETRNEFGDIEQSWDGVHRYFGVANHDVVIYDNVVFKSTRYIDYYSKGAEDGVQKYQNWERYVDADGNAWLARYNTGEQPEKWDSVTAPESGYYRAVNFSYTEGLHYFEITGVTGAIILMDFPDEYWTEIDGEKYIIVADEIFSQKADVDDSIAITETGSRYNYLCE